MHAYDHTHTYILTLTYIHTHAHTHIYIHKPGRLHAHTHAQTYIHTHAYRPTHIHTCNYTCTYALIYIQVVPVVKWLSSYEADTVTRVQILDEADFISFGKNMNLTILPPAIINSRADCVFNPGMVTNLGERKTLNSSPLKFA